jgi:hypothetical protein
MPIVAISALAAYMFHVKQIYPQKGGFYSQIKTYAIPEERNTLWFINKLSTNNAFCISTRFHL